MKLRLMDRIARSLGYAPQSLIDARWQRISVPLDLPDLKAGHYSLSAWVSLPAKDNDAFWLSAWPQLEQTRPDPPYVVTGPAGTKVIANDGFEDS